MTVAPKIKSGPPQEASPAPCRQERHLQLVPPPKAPVEDEARRVREIRWITALLAVVTAALFGLWTAAMLGAADAAWWPVVFGVVLVGVVALGIVVVLKTR